MLVRLARVSVKNFVNIHFFVPAHFGPVTNGFSILTTIDGFSSSPFKLTLMTVLPDSAPRTERFFTKSLGVFNCDCWWRYNFILQVEYSSSFNGPAQSFAQKFLKSFSRTFKTCLRLSLEVLFWVVCPSGTSYCQSSASEFELQLRRKFLLLNLPHDTISGYQGQRDDFRVAFQLAFNAAVGLSFDSFSSNTMFWSFFSLYYRSFRSFRRRRSWLFFYQCTVLFRNFYWKCKFWLTTFLKCKYSYKNFLVCLPFLRTHALFCTKKRARTTRHLACQKLMCSSSDVDRCAHRVCTLKKLLCSAFGLVTTINVFVLILFYYSGRPGLC